MNEMDGQNLPSMRRIDPDYYLDHPEAKRDLIEWMNAHGVSPMIVPRDARLEFVSADYLEIQVYDTSANGLPEWDKETGEVKMRWLNVQIAYPFPMEAVS